MVETILRFIRQPRWDDQHGWRRAIFQSMASLGLTGMHVLPMHRRWIDVHTVPMPLVGLDPTFDGFRIVQISDLHFSPVVLEAYLDHFVDWINDLEPDLVVVTGDLITGGYAFARRVAVVLNRLHAKHGIVCTFGNHDYSLHGKRRPKEARRRGDFLEQQLERHGLIVLRNEVHRVAPAGAGGKPLCIVGLDDDWANQIDAERAFAGVSDDEPIICLSHNPATTNDLLAYPWQWLLSGHTHGRSLGQSRVGKVVYRKMNRHFTHGYYAVDGRHVYVNRGLSYGQRKHAWCRPEVTVFELKPV